MAVDQVVNPAATTTAVVSTTGSPSVVGQSVTFTGTVSVTSPGSGPASTGNIEFFDGGTAVASCNGAAGVTVNGSGQAICVVSSYGAAGSHTITAQYLGSTNFAASVVSPSITQVVNAAGSTTIVVSTTGSPSVVSTAVTYTATVSSSAPGSGTPSTGNVEFFDGGAAITGCTALAVGSSGTAACTVTYGVTGSHMITAQYLGSPNYVASVVSPSIIQVVQISGAPATTAMVVSSANPSVVGQPVVFTATVTSGSGTPTTGNVEFFDSGVALAACGGATGVPVNASGVAACTPSTYLAIDSDVITVQYLGTTNFAASAVASSITQVVNAANTSVVVVSSVNPSAVGQSVTYTATVSASSPGTGNAHDWQH